MSYCILITRYIKTKVGSFILVMEQDHSLAVLLIHADCIIAGTYYNNEYKEIKRKKQIVLEFFSIICKQPIEIDSGNIFRKVESAGIFDHMFTGKDKKQRKYVVFN